MFEKMKANKRINEEVSRTILAGIEGWMNFEHDYHIKKGEYQAEMEKLDRELSERSLTAEKEIAVKRAEIAVLETNNGRELLANKTVLEEKEAVIKDLREQMKFLLTKLNTEHSHCPANPTVGSITGVDNSQ